MAVPAGSGPRPRLWSFPARVTNVTLLLALLVAFATGAGAMATGSERGRWVVIAHGIGAMVILALVPAKLRVVRAGLKRARPSRWFSLTLAALVVATVLFGLGYATGLVRSVGGVEGMWLHVATALALVPLLVWHLLARWVRPRRTDLSRRLLLRTGALGATAAGLYVATEAVVSLADLPGAQRRFTGSYEQGSFEPAAMPNTIWLNDSVPTVDADAWRLTIVDALGRYELSLADLSRATTTVRATLDCTSGWYAHQDWTGVPARTLIRESGSGSSLLVRSATGYELKLPMTDLDGLLLATAVGGQPLSRGHGYPLRLVAPGRRGFWWVKWVDHIEVVDSPWWWQSPFPLT